MLDRYGLTEVIGSTSIYDTLAEAIDAFRAAGTTAPSPVTACSDKSITRPPPTTP
jgi:hypothetical protein